MSNGIELLKLTNKIWHKLMDKEQILSELNFKAVRSSGAGGQNVNKVSSKVVLNILILNCDEDRSQFKNKAIVTKRFFDLITQSLHIEKIRKETRIPKSVIRKRMKDKKSISETKKNRKRPEF